MRGWSSACTAHWSMRECAPPSHLVGMAHVGLVAVVHVPGGARDEQHPELAPRGHRRERGIHKVHRQRARGGMDLPQRGSTTR